MLAWQIRSSFPSCRIPPDCSTSICRSGSRHSCGRPQDRQVDLRELVKRRIAEPRGEQFGHALEHFILMELAAHASYSELQYDIHFWRTRSGLEVDFILGAGEVAIEVKGSSILRDRELRALHAFVQEYRPRDALVVSTELVEREVGGIRIVPWQIFRSRLWAGEIIA